MHERLFTQLNQAHNGKLKSLLGVERDYQHAD